MVNLVFAALLFSSNAVAASNSLLTAGLGASVGSQQGFNYESSAFIEGRARLRVLRGLGLEAAYNPMVLSQDGPMYDSAFKVFALIHIIPTDPVGAYLKLGTGSSSPDGLFRDTPTATYHVGLGANVYLDDNFALGVEGVMSLPSARDIIDNIRGGRGQQRYKFSADIFYYL